MHYRDGREAKNGDTIVKLEGGKIVGFGVLHDAVAGNDYCNGRIAPLINESHACLIDSLHIDDIAALLAREGLDTRPEGK